MKFVLPVTPPTMGERVHIAMATHPDYNPEGYLEARELVKKQCAEDAAWFVSAFGFTFDPRTDVEEHDIPFVLYDFQVDAMRWLDARIRNRQDGIVEKSRDMGVTWITMTWIAHGWLFKKGFQALIGSRKEDLVDNWTMDSHFGKLEYFIDKLPYWLLPKGYSTRNNRMKLKIINPETRNVIMGESANSEFSRQGRYTVVLFDEAAFWPDLTSALRAAAQATRTRILVSTPNGYNTFARERDSNRYRVLTLHWTKHPLKTQEWYEFEKGRMSPEDVAQELDISYHRSARGVVYPTFSSVPRGDYPYLKNYSLFTSWDFGVADDTAIIWWAKDPNTGKLRIVDSYKNNGKAIDFYVPFVIGMIPADSTHDYTFEELLMIHKHASWPRSINFGDPDVAKRGMATGTSAADVLATHKVAIFTNTKQNDFRSRKSATDVGIRNIEGINTDNSDGCNELVESLSNARFPQRSPDSRSTSGVVLPIHDWTEAYRSAFEYFFVNQPLVVENWERPAPSRAAKMVYDNY